MLWPTPTPTCKRWRNTLVCSNIATGVSKTVGVKLPGDVTSCGKSSSQLLALVISFCMIVVVVAPFLLLLVPLQSAADCMAYQ